MIDWISCRLPLTHSEALNGGRIISLSGDGDIEWSTKKRLKLRGSYESNIHVRSVETTRAQDGTYKEIDLDGNFVKYHQGHNFFGTDDLTGLVSETFFKIVDLLGVSPTQHNWDSIIQGNYSLKRVDCTMMVDLGSLNDVEAAIFSLEQYATMRYRGRGILLKGTLYFGKNSRRWTLVIYAKGREIQARGHQLPNEINTPSMVAYASSKLRLELRFRSMELKDRGLNIASNWGDNTSEESLHESIRGLNVSGKHTIPPKLLAALPSRLIGVYALWKEGHDIKAMYPRKTFYRYRKQFLEHDIDISIKQGNREEPAPNIIPFQRLLCPKLCDQIPAWAIGTPLYFEPRANVR